MTNLSITIRELFHILCKRLADAVKEQSKMISNRDRDHCNAVFRAAMVGVWNLIFHIQRIAFSHLTFLVYNSLAIPVSPVQLKEKGAGNDVGYASE